MACAGFRLRDLWLESGQYRAESISWQCEAWHFSGLEVGSEISGIMKWVDKATCDRAALLSGTSSLRSPLDKWGASCFAKGAVASLRLLSELQNPASRGVSGLIANEEVSMKPSMKIATATCSFRQESSSSSSYRCESDGSLQSEFFR